VDRFDVVVGERQPPARGHEHQPAVCGHEHAVVAGVDRRRHVERVLTFLQTVAQLPEHAPGLRHRQGPRGGGFGLARCVRDIRVR
jgi:hypothetical protein